MSSERKKIGILGGSFNPAHKGHVVISKEAKKRFGLKYIIWAITKKNPFKKKPFFSLKQRISESKKAVKKYKKIKVLYLDDKIKSSRTIKVFNYFRSIFTGTPYYSYPRYSRPS